MGGDRSSFPAKPSAGQGGARRRLMTSELAKGAAVYAADGNRLGRIERVMVDAATGEIVEAVVSFASGKHVIIDTNEHTVPWSLLTYSSRFGGYELRIGRDPPPRA
jgi:sporulation protein YlmC with PRC-barrel domain